MKIRTLDNVSLEQLLTVFNESFSDYRVPIKFNLNQLKFDLQAKNISHQYSVGAFEKGKLVGFVLHGQKKINESIYVYNGGTGVIPEKRGNRITLKMYEFIIPKLKETNVSSIQLEVNSTNKPAIKSYENVGFKINRKLNCYKGHFKNLKSNPLLEIIKTENLDLKLIEEFSDVKPPWLNSRESILILKKHVCHIIAKVKGETVGYLALLNNSNRIIQIVVNKKSRRKYIATTLLKYVADKDLTETLIMNIDSTDLALNSLFENCGLINYLQQYEMFLNLRSTTSNIWGSNHQ